MSNLALAPSSLDTGTAIAGRARSIEQALAAIGWQLLSVDIDIDREAARIELKRGDLHVMLDARHGRASLTREIHDRRQQRIGRKGDITVVERIEPRLLGRTRCDGLRSGLRTLSHYVADNAAVAIGHDQARELFRPLLQSASPTLHQHQ